MLTEFYIGNKYKIFGFSETCELVFIAPDTDKHKARYLVIYYRESDNNHLSHWAKAESFEEREDY